jgi:hypothetical protein
MSSCTRRAKILTDARRALYLLLAERPQTPEA